MEVLRKLYLSWFTVLCIITGCTIVYLFPAAVRDSWAYEASVEKAKRFNKCSKIIVYINKDHELASKYPNGTATFERSDVEYLIKHNIENPQKKVWFPHFFDTLGVYRNPSLSRECWFNPSEMTDGLVLQSYTECMDDLVTTYYYSLRWHFSVETARYSECFQTAYTYSLLWLILLIFTVAFKKWLAWLFSPRKPAKSKQSQSAKEPDVINVEYTDITQLDTPAKRYEDRKSH